MYIENPKTKGSGVICAIPQTGTCPMRCSDCFFQSGRSYLEPLDQSLPNLPSPEQAKGLVVRMNDGNDSNNQRELVQAAASTYEDVFFNTAMPHDLEGYKGPVVLTVNPGKMTDVAAHFIDPIPKNLMMVRFRTNTWNTGLLDQVIQHYSRRAVPIVLTFMAYYQDDIPPAHRYHYIWRSRTMNSYWVINSQSWEGIRTSYKNNPLVHTCGASADNFSCRNCGNCIREYFVTKTKMKESEHG